MIDHLSSTPLYIQLEEQLETGIINGKYRPGDRLPSENELCREYGVSRTTVRQTLGLLAQKDLVYSSQGKGTFVKVPLISHELSKIVRFAASLKRKGLTGCTKIYSFASEAANTKAASALGVPFCNLNLVGYVKEMPVVYYRSFIRNELKERMYKAAAELEMQGAAFSSYDLYDKIGIKLRRVEQVLGAMNSNRELNGIFRFTRDNALIVLESVYYSDENVPLEYKIGYYRSDIYTFHLQRELDY